MKPLSPICSVTTSTPVLSSRNLTLHFDQGRTKALNGVDIEIIEGEFVAVTGPSGCGKSSLLNLIGTLDQASSGELFFRQQPYSSMTDLSEFRREQVGFVFQSFHLIPTLTTLGNVLLPTVGRAGDHNATARATALLQQMGLESRLDHFPSQLSGGERQRVAIARALINDPTIILADEPTGSLDSENASHVLDVIANMRLRKSLTVVMVTHDPNVAARADREICMRDGKIVTDNGVNL
ncbi:ABC transporter ATP-binding protein [Mariprofundus sp. EBB-1]|uniref:ABC transporter ATP-binding protein n=1 Tax=Mariprofundus sp. EBB-1 TaxID=2650971 RepID=UPI000EF24249|nr:ABC transporter ATP-binding protein [Mariprofundus sp. EBB-1]RLL50434.1 ABC transporter ATP-binding protein [Mariprofundus sp. EBB-1]